MLENIDILILILLDSVERGDPEKKEVAKILTYIVKQFSYRNNSGIEEVGVNHANSPADMFLPIYGK